MIFDISRKCLALIVLFVAFTTCQEVDEDPTAVVLDAEARVGKRGLSIDGYSGSYLHPSTRGLQRQFYPGSELGGYDGVNYGIGSSNFAGGFGGGANYPGSLFGQNSYGNYPYRGGYQTPTSYVYQRQYNTPVNTYPLGGIGTVGPYGGAYSGLGSAVGSPLGSPLGGSPLNSAYNGAYNRFGGIGDGIGYGGYQQQQQFGGLF